MLRSFQQYWSFNNKFTPVFLRLQQYIRLKKYMKQSFFLGDWHNASLRENCPKKAPMDDIYKDSHLIKGLRLFYLGYHKWFQAKKYNNWSFSLEIEMVIVSERHKKPLILLLNTPATKQKNEVKGGKHSKLWHFSFAIYIISFKINFVWNFCIIKNFMLC